MRLAASIASAVLLVFITLIAAITATLTAVFGSGSDSGPSPEALADIPADYLALYQQAAPVCPGLDWPVLAAVGKVETDHGRLNAPGVDNGENSAGAAVISRSLAV